MIKTRLLKLLKGSGKYIGANIFWQWIALLFQIAAVFAAGNMIQQLFEKTLDQQVMLQTAGIVILAICARFLCEKGAAYASYRASADVKTVLRKQIYEKLLRLGAAYKEKVSTSEVVQVSAEGVEQLEIYYGRYLPQLFYSLLAPITLFAVLSPISIKACIVLLVCVPLIPMSIVAVQKFAKKLLSKYWGIYTELGDSFLENLQGLTTLKIYQADEQKAKEMDDESERFRKITMKVLTMQLNSVSVMDIVAYGGAAIGMIVTVKEYLAGNVSLAGAFTIILLASEFFIPLRLLGSFFHIAMNGMSASDKIFKILDMEEPKRGEHEIEGEQMDVTLQHVEFSYEPERKVLQDISLTIPSGKFVSLVGLYDWENCPMIQQIEDETAIPSTFTVIPVKKRGTQYQIPEVMFTSEALVIFTKEDGSGWELREGDEIQIHLEEYETKDFRVEGQMIGYKLIHNGELKKAEDVREGLRQNCILSATEKGEYYPCLIGRSSDITTLKNGTITVIEK